MRTILLQLSKGLYRLRYGILVGWLITLTFCIYFLFSNETRLIQTPLSGATYTEAYAVEHLLEDNFHFDPDLSGAIVIEGKDKTGQLRERILARFPHINAMHNIPSREPHHTQIYYFTFDPSISLPQAQLDVPELRQMLRDWEAETGSPAYLTGHLGFVFDMNHSAHQESSQNEKIALILGFFILVFNFGSLLASLLPILMGATALIYMSVVSHWLHLPLTPVSLVINSMVGLALAIDYSLFMVSRYQEEWNAHGDPEKALAATLKHAGETILFSALIMICSIVVLLIPEVSSSRIVVQGLCLVISLSLGVSLVILPAILVSGQRWLGFPRFLTQWIESMDKYRFWKRFSEHVVKYPKTYFIFSLTSLLLLAAPVATMRLWEPVHSLTGPDTGSQKGYQALKDDGWGGEILPINVVVQSKDGPITSLENLKRIEALGQYATHLPKVASISSLTELNPQMTLLEKQGFFNSLNALSSVGVIPPDHPVFRMLTRDQSMALVNIHAEKEINIHDNYAIIGALRDYALKQQDIEIKVGGVVARSRDFTVEIYSKAPLMLSLIVVGIFIILFIYMRAFLLPIKAAIMNFMPIMGAFGFMTLVFQYGWFDQLFHTPNNGGITSIVPVILFCIVFGLSMDYEVLILSRITEAYRQGNDVKEAVVEGLARSGAVITGAALILLGVFFPGVFSASPLVKEIAIGITMAIVLDATLLRLFLVPSFMLLMGEWNWWNPLQQKKESRVLNKK